MFPLKDVDIGLILDMFDQIGYLEPDQEDLEQRLIRFKYNRDNTHTVDD